MLTKYGVDFLIWLDEEVIPEAYDTLDRLSDFVGAWRKLLGV